MIDRRFQFVSCLLIAVVLSATVRLSVAAIAGGLDEVGENPNVILITISSLGARHVGCLGYPRDTTPRFDEFARENTLFRHAYATSSWTMPAHGSIFASLYPSEHGATHIRRKLGEAHRTLAEILAGRGYFCAGFCCGPHVTEDNGFAQGFHTYDDFSAPMLLMAMEGANSETFDINQRRSNDLINNAAMKWLENNSHQPFFLFLHYYDNHWDFRPPAPYAQLYDPGYDGSIDGTRVAREPLYSNMPDKRDVEHMVALYDGEVRQTDEDLGRMLTFLRDGGLFASSIIVIAGDHGEQFYEHGNTSHHGLYEELIHVPLTVSIPLASSKRRVVDGLISQIDILPTLLDYLGVPLPEACRGLSALPLIIGRADTLRPYILAEYTGGAVADSFAIRSTRWKCFQDDRGNAFAFDLSLDPGEQQEIISTEFTGEPHDLAVTLGIWVEAIIKEATDVIP